MGTNAARSTMLLVLAFCGCAKVDDGGFSRPRGGESLVIYEATVGAEGRLLFVPATISGTQVRLAIDTGCSRSILDRRLSSLLVSTGKVASVTTASGPLSASVCERPTIHLGDLALDQPGWILCADLSQIGDVIGDDCDGVLGMDVLQDCIVQVDFDEGTLRFLARGPAEDPASETLALSFDAQGLPCLAVRCGATLERLLIDTGSNTMSLPGATFDRLLLEGNLQSGDGYPMATPAGMTIVQCGLLSELRLGSFLHQDIVCDRGSVGLLGMRVLSRYLVTLDFPSRMVHLREGRRHSDADARGMVGLVAWPSKHGFQVKVVSPGGPARLAGILVADEIVAIDGEPAETMDLFRLGQVLTAHPGQTLSVDILRGERRLKADIVVRDRFRTAAKQARDGGNR